MSNIVEINGVALIPVKEAATAVSYSRDYVTRLAREGKIVASLINRQWFIDPASLARFSAEAALLDDLRKTELRTERKRELLAKTAFSALDAHLIKQDTRQRLDAFAVAAAVSCLGILVGVGMYATALVPGYKLVDLTSALTPLAPAVGPGSLAEDTAPAASPFRNLDEAGAKPVLLTTTLEERPVFTASAEVVPLSNDQAGILLFADRGSVRTVAEVERMFSDPVKVTFSDSRQGVIVYRVSPTETIEYPFVALPAINPTAPVDME